MVRLIVLTMLFLTSTVVTAQDFYWELDPNFLPGQTFASPNAACSAMHSSRGLPHYGVRRINDGAFTCLWDWQSSVGRAVRRGTTCPPDTDFNSETGNCDAPEPSICQAFEGQTSPFQLSGNAPDANFQLSPGGGYQGQLSQSCLDGCAAQVKSVKKCNFTTAGSYICEGEAVHTGAECDPADVQPVDLQEEPLPPPGTEETKIPCAYVDQPDGTQKCQSVQSVDKEGQACGTIDGVQFCTSVAAKKDSTTIDTTVSSTDNGDGTTTQVKTDTATVTKCNQMSCNTTTTTNTTTTVIGSGGQTISENSSCTGGSCDGNTPGGSGDCITGCEDDDTFTGDFPENEDVGTFGDSVQGYMDRISSSPIASAIDGVSFPKGGSCSFPSVSVVYLGNINFDSICQNAGWLDPLFVVFLGIWAFGAVRVFMSA